VSMIISDRIDEFWPYLDPETELYANGESKLCIERSLVKNAPQSAIDAFEEYKKDYKDHEKVYEEAKKNGRIP